MRAHIGLTLLAALLCLLLAGCGQSGGAAEPEDTTPTESTEGGAPSSEQTPEGEEGTVPAGDTESSEAEDPSVAAPEDGAEADAPQYTDNFDVDDAAVTAFAEEIKGAVADKDVEALADLVAFPIYLGSTDGGESVETREEFVALGADRIFTEELMSEIAEADTEGLSPSMAGFSLSKSGRPNIIFGVSEGRLAVVGINY